MQDNKVGLNLLGHGPGGDYSSGSFLKKGRSDIMFDKREFEELVNIIEKSQGAMEIQDVAQNNTLVILDKLLPSKIPKDTDDILGCGNIVDIDFRDADIFKIRTLSFRRKSKGTATEVIRWLENFAYQKGVSRILIGGVGRSNTKAIDLYQKFVARLFGLTPNSPRGSDPELF